MTRGEFPVGEAVERNVAQGRSRGRDGGLGVLLGAIEMRIFQRELVSDVVPNQWRGGEFDGVIESGESFVVLTKIQVGIAETDLQFARYRE